MPHECFHVLNLLHFQGNSTFIFLQKRGPSEGKVLKYENLMEFFILVSGHDSAEDALTCMQLMHWKVKETLKAKP